MPAIPGVILAGGGARRMGGGDKCLQLLGGRRILDRVVERLAPQCGPLALSANGDPARFADFGLPVLTDSLPDRPGPLAGVLAGLDWATELGHSAIVTAAGDTPFLPRDLVERLLAAVLPGRIVLAATAEASGRIQHHPTFGLWPVALRDDLRRRLADGTARRVRGWVEDHGAATALFPAGPVDAFFNINRPEDIAGAAALLETGA